MLQIPLVFQVVAVSSEQRVFSDKVKNEDRKYNVHSLDVVFSAPSVATGKLQVKRVPDSVPEIKFKVGGSFTCPVLGYSVEKNCEIIDVDYQKIIPVKA